MTTNEVKPDAHDIVSAMRIAMAHAPAEVQQIATEGLAFEASPAGQTLLTAARTAGRLLARSPGAFGVTLGSTGPRGRLTWRLLGAIRAAREPAPARP